MTKNGMRPIHPGIDNAGHIGGAITGLLIALGFAIAYRQRLKTEPTDQFIYQTINDIKTVSSQPKTSAKPTIMWQLLPWVVILLIAIGFVWWWQDIHHQILQVLNTIE